LSEVTRFSISVQLATGDQATGTTTCFESTASPIILSSNFASSTVKDSAGTLTLLAREVNES